MVLQFHGAGEEAHLHEGHRPQSDALGLLEPKEFVFFAPFQDLLVDELFHLLVSA